MLNPKTVLALVVSLVVLSVLGALGVLIYSLIKNRETIKKSGKKFTELWSKINPFPWISLLVYSVFAFIAATKPVLSEWAFFFNIFLFISLILLTLYSLSGEKWEHKYSLGNDVMLGGDKYDYYNGNITPNLIVGLMGVIGFFIAFRTGDASGWALLAMVSFLTLSVLSFHLPQLIDDEGWRYGLIWGVLGLKVALTLFFMYYIRESSVQG